MQPSKFFTVIVVLSLTLFSGVAISVAQIAPPEISQETTPEKFIAELGSTGVAIVKEPNLSHSERSEKYGKILSNAFDMPTISRFVLGRAWVSATPEQKQEFLRLFQQGIARNYGERLSMYNGENFQVTGSRKENDKETIVNSVIMHQGGKPPTPMDWRVRQTDGKTAVLDVVIEGISQSVTQRQEYASILQRNGGNFDELLTIMRQNLAQNTAAQSSR